MKRKIINVLFALVLVLSLTMVVAVPATATAPVTFNVVPFSLYAATTNGTAVWSTTQHKTGTSSVLLTHDATHTGSDYVQFVPDTEATLADLATIDADPEYSFWYYASAAPGPQLELKFTDASSDGYVEVTLMPAQGGACVINTWTKVSVLAASGRAIWYGVGETGTAFDWENNAGVYTLAQVEALINAETGVDTASDWVLTRVRAELWEAGTRTCYIDDITIDGTTYYGLIQDAIDSAADDDIISVWAGAYTENVNVDESLTLEGASSATVTVSAADVNAHVFNVSADSVTISGFTVSGAADPYAGIYLGEDVTLCNIHDNILTGNFDGIFLDIGSNHNTLTSNTASSNTRQGFEIIQSDNNTFTSNTANSNTKYGFKMESASHNTFTSNTANSNSQDGFRLTTGSNPDATGCNYNTFTSNTVNSNTNKGFNMLGRVAGDSNNNVLTNNTISSNAIGISIGDAFVDVSTMTVSYNIIAENTGYGISNSGTGTLDATANWWGDAAGPTVATNPYYAFTDGDVVTVDTVTYIPWLIHKDLAAGWNIFSTPITSGATTDTIAEALNFWTSDYAKVTAAYYYNANTQVWAVPPTTLTPLVPVYLNLSSAATIDVLMSTTYSSPPAKTMYQGWNLVGPAELYTMDVDDALGSAYYGTGGSNPVGYSQVVSPGIHQTDAWTWLRGVLMYTGDTVPPNMIPTEGYWAYMVNQGTLGGFTYTPITEQEVT